ncbi:MAG: hypothetical protein HC824_21120 [Synechococcales cyanobacterium RM1_1_8]|nr:hypothetical protein [Synechococcales cyanobacterium RM1_1_8]
MLVSCGDQPSAPEDAASSQANSATTSSETPAAEGPSEQFNAPKETDIAEGGLKEEDPTATIANATINASIEVEAQSLSQGAVLIDGASVPETGWVVIHEGSATGAVLGQSQVFGALNPRIRIPLSKEVPAGAELYAGLYEDLGTANTYEPGTDKPFTAAGAPVGAAFKIE